MEATDVWQDSLPAINDNLVKLPNSQGKSADTLTLCVPLHQTWLRLAYPRSQTGHCTARMASSTSFGKIYFFNFLAAGHL